MWASPSSSGGAPGDPDLASDVDSEAEPGTCTVQVYLYTLSCPTDAHPDHQRPEEFTRLDFAAAVLEAYAARQPMNRVVQYAVALEQHAAGNDAQRSLHYHMALKAERVHRYGGVVRYLRDRKIFVHASATHHQYHTAFRYLVMPSA